MVATRDIYIYIYIYIYTVHTYIHIRIRVYMYSKNVYEQYMHVYNTCALTVFDTWFPIFHWPLKAATDDVTIINDLSPALVHDVSYFLVQEEVLEGLRVLRKGNPCIYVYIHTYKHIYVHIRYIWDMICPWV